MLPGTVLLQAHGYASEGVSLHGHRGWLDMLCRNGDLSRQDLWCRARGEGQCRPVSPEHDDPHTRTSGNKSRSITKLFALHKDKNKVKSRNQATADNAGLPACMILAPSISRDYKEAGMEQSYAVGLCRLDLLFWCAENKSPTSFQCSQLPAIATSKHTPTSSQFMSIFTIRQFPRSFSGLTAK